MAPSAAMRCWENVVVRADGSVDYADGSKTENTRVSYPLSHIDNIVSRCPARAIRRR